MTKLKASIEKNFTAHFFPSFSEEHQKTITTSVLDLVDTWLEEHVIEEDLAFEKTKCPETVENYHNVILNVLKQLQGDLL